MKRDPAIVSKTMSHIRGKNTGIERKLRAALTKRGLRYHLYSSRVLGHPDILFPSLKVAVFCDSEFWHGYHFEEQLEKSPSLDEYWVNKIHRNTERDRIVNEGLAKAGYKVLRYWGQEIEKDLDRVVDEIEKTVLERKRIAALKDSIEEFTTLTYIERDDCYLLLHRVKEKGDINQGKWIGVGGHLEGKESPTAAMKREVMEETGLTVLKYVYYGYIDFLNDACPPERMYLYKVTDFEGEMKECDEGELAWIKKSQVMDLPMWEGDKAFLPLLEKGPEGILRMNVIYHGDELIGVDGPCYVEKKPAKRKKKHGKR